MSRRRLILASQSPARLRLLRDAGFDPSVVVSGVAEDDLGDVAPHELALVLAERKASVVAESVAGAAIVIGCDSVLDLDGRPVGKPPSHEAATARWQAMRGRSATLVTGHCVIETGSGARASATASTVVRFGCPTDGEIDAYVASGEPLAVAGAFTLLGRSAPFIRGIDGDPGNVIGLSLPLFRELLGRVGVEMADLW